MGSNSLKLFCGCFTGIGAGFPNSCSLNIYVQAHQELHTSASCLRQAIMPEAEEYCRVQMFLWVGLQMLFTSVWWPVCVCSTDFIWSSISSPECHVTFSKPKMSVNWHLYFMLKHHLNVTRLVVRVISICKMSMDVWFFPSHVTLHVETWIVHIDWRAILFCASFCMSNVKNLQKLCQIYTLLVTPPPLIFERLPKKRATYIPY